MNYYKQEIKEMKKELRVIRQNCKHLGVRLTSCMNRQSSPYASQMSKRVFELKTNIEKYQNILNKTE